MSNKERHELRIGGTGGQGVITIGYALAAAAASGEYEYVTRFPIYMATMRGGPAFCTVIFSDEEIASPILSMSEWGIAMEMGAYGRLKKEMKKGGTLVVNSSIVNKIDETDEYKVVPIPVTELAQKMGKPFMANVVMLGAYRQLTGLMSDEKVLAAIKKDLGDSEEKFAATKEAYEKGAAYVKENLS